MNNDALIKTGLKAGSPLAGVYGNEDDLYALAQRIMDVHSFAEEMGEEGCLYMAQIALATGARPLPEELGEIPVWRDKKTGELIFMLGFPYFVRVMESHGGGVWWPTARSMSKEERTEYKVFGDDLGYVCGLLRKSDVEIVSKLNVNPEEMLGNMRYVGIGKVSVEEMAEGKPPIGRTWASVGMRRASKDAVAKAFGTSLKPYVLDGPRPQPDQEKPKRFTDLTDEEAVDLFAYG